MLAFAREVIEEAGKHKAAFARIAMTQPKIDALAADIAAMETKLGEKASAHPETVGATAGLDEQVEKGMKAETILDAMMEVIYEDNPVKFAERKSAHHVKSLKRPTAKEEDKNKPET